MYVIEHKSCFCLLKEFIMDRRQVKTRQAIYKGFIELLDTKSYSSITVSNIIEKANIGRSTFYQHFESKDEIPKEMFIDFFSHILHKEKNLTNMEHPKNYNMGKYEKLTHILYHLKDENFDIIKLLDSAVGDLAVPYFESFIKDISTDIIKSNKMFNRNIPIDFQISLFVSSFMQTIRWWHKQGLKEKPEKVISHFINFILP